MSFGHLLHFRMIKMILMIFAEITDQGKNQPHKKQNRKKYSQYKCAVANRGAKNDHVNHE